MAFYSDSDYTNYSNAYLNEPKVIIDMDKFALELYKWKNIRKKYPNYSDEEFEGQYKKPQIEDFLKVISLPSSSMAKSSIK